LTPSSAWTAPELPLFCATGQRPEPFAQESVISKSRALWGHSSSLTSSIIASPSRPSSTASPSSPARPSSSSLSASAWPFPRPLLQIVSSRHYKRKGSRIRIAPCKGGPPPLPTRSGASQPASQWPSSHKSSTKIVYRSGNDTSCLNLPTGYYSKLTLVVVSSSSFV
jgi:hypothetical protein